MATDEQKYLADVVKSTHATLREEALNYGPEVAWERHVSRKDVLEKYASSMQKLATTYWLRNNSNAENATLCRMQWIKSECERYFLNGGREKYNDREESIKMKMNTGSVGTEHSVNCKFRTGNEKISLLDVGSCYNPFESLSEFDVTAVDLNGVPDKVSRCDFLNVSVGKEKVLSDDKLEVLQLPKNSFDVVVFSLFLEYLPCPKQRYLCCKKAYEVLQPGGILFIVSPDSKHVNANAKLMKSWRYVLSELGFMRIKYEKLRHIHCIIFRKCAFKDVAIRWANMQTLPKNDPLFQTNCVIYIPQDFRTVSENKEQKKEDYDTDELSFMFSELPFDET